MLFTGFITKLQLASGKSILDELFVKLVVSTYIG